jgi:hypothetical protein
VEGPETFAGGTRQVDVIRLAGVALVAWPDRRRADGQLRHTLVDAGLGCAQRLHGHLVRNRAVQVAHHDRQRAHADNRHEHERDQHHRESESSLTAAAHHGS